MKIYIFCVILALLAMLTGCGKSQEKEEESFPSQLKSKSLSVTALCLGKAIQGVVDTKCSKPVNLHRISITLVGK